MVLLWGFLFVFLFFLGSLCHLPSLICLIELPASGSSLPVNVCDIDLYPPLGPDAVTTIHVAIEGCKTSMWLFKLLLKFSFVSLCIFPFSPLVFLEYDLVFFLFPDILSDLEYIQPYYQLSSQFYLGRFNFLYWEFLNIYDNRVCIYLVL